VGNTRTGVRLLFGDPYAQQKRKAKEEKERENDY
jgi:hypothetical protein